MKMPPLSTTIIIVMVLIPMTLTAPTLTSICEEYEKEVKESNSNLKNAITKVYDAAVPFFIEKAKHIKRLHLDALEPSKTVKAKDFNTAKHHQLTENIEERSKQTITVLENRKAEHKMDKCNVIVITLLTDVAKLDYRTRLDFQMHGLATHDGLLYSVEFEVPDMVSKVNNYDWEKSMPTVFRQSMHDECGRFEQEWLAFKESILERANKCRSHVALEYGPIVNEEFNQNLHKLKTEPNVITDCRSLSIKYENRLSEELGSLESIQRARLTLQSYGNNIKIHFDYHLIYEAIRILEFVLTDCK